ncbi:hypothetical protein SAMN02949497_3422 [Methylomagnum ishizawai]|uniref:Uncharacterized protein n=1 Tax=Methylomagnum ishizawai TaxID=1760988 RepID=A0A1Y6D674_9GAMM|nr:hypothetical protein [Methylomagnum ishizawai]SMF96042.1 hypothetical protein SAMN02949497_3422 [Methylomagnum ishizawai]
MQNVKTPAERDALKPVLAVHVEADDSWDCYLPGDELPPMPLPAPVAACSPWQLRRYLNQSGLRTAVDAYVAAADQDIQDGWATAAVFLSTDPFVVMACAALGLDPYTAIQVASEIVG